MTPARLARRDQRLDPDAADFSGILNMRNAGKRRGKMIGAITLLISLLNPSQSALIQRCETVSDASALSADSPYYLYEHGGCCGKYRRDSQEVHPYSWADGCTFSTGRPLASLHHCGHASPTSSAAISAKR
jgi:hypothetical protein